MLQRKKLDVFSLLPANWSLEREGKVSLLYLPSFVVKWKDIGQKYIISDINLNSTLSCTYDNMWLTHFCKISKKLLELMICHIIDSFLLYNFFMQLFVSNCGLRYRRVLVWQKSVDFELKTWIYVRKNWGRKYIISDNPLWRKEVLSKTNPLASYQY